jgi:hypothetical protein
MINQYINLPTPNIEQSERYKPEDIDTDVKKVKGDTVHGSFFLMHPKIGEKIGIR